MTEARPDEGWAKDNLHYWLRDYRGFLEFFFSQMFNEPHSTKPEVGYRPVATDGAARAAVLLADLL